MISIIVTLQKTVKQKTAGLNQSQALRVARLSGAQVTTQKKFGLRVDLLSVF
jgi:hypothetical protein